MHWIFSLVHMTDPCLYLLQIDLVDTIVSTYTVLHQKAIDDTELNTSKNNTIRKCGIFHLDVYKQRALKEDKIWQHD